MRKIGSQGQWPQFLSVIFSKEISEKFISKEKFGRKSKTCWSISFFISLDLGFESLLHDQNIKN